MTISDIYQMMRSGELIINREYQRGKGLWPDNARSYFIDTLLNGFPFPKVVIRQIVDLKTMKTKREIIDGQQRLTTIRDFIDNKLKLTAVSQKFKGLTFDCLSEEVSREFLAYEVSSDNIISASNEEILEVFRRINSYTLPLNQPEKRHATYQGEFKWYIMDLAEYVTPFFEKYKVLTLRSISRMEDADLITECCQIIIEGIQTRSYSKLDKIYKRFDTDFNIKDKLSEEFLGTFNFIKDNLYEVFENCNVQSYNFYALIGALIFNKYGFSDEKRDLKEYSPIGIYCVDVNKSVNLLIRMFTEVDEKIEDGDFSAFVKASKSTTQGYPHRLIRIKTLIKVLRDVK
jgi:hypothetical protein